jgi:hypothetical protein
VRRSARGRSLTNALSKTTVARVQRGSHITLEQTNVGNAVWMPQRLEVRASATLLFLRSLAIQRIFASTIAGRDGSYIANRLRLAPVDKIDFVAPKNPRHHSARDQSKNGKIMGFRLV